VIDYDAAAAGANGKQAPYEVGDRVTMDWGSTKATGIITTILQRPDGPARHAVVRIDGGQVADDPLTVTLSLDLVRPLNG
jgi:hypothetical protein